MNNKKKVLVSGIQSSGRIHIGNYFGAMRQNIELSNGEDFESYIFIADYHSMTSLTDAVARRQYSFDLACAYLACGLDTDQVTLFKQSDVPEHTELSWILSTVTPMPMLMLAHSYKDKEAKNAEVNVGLFTYPVLMAADILMYNADIVPVGKDQAQHVEITREIGGKFNRAYGQEFFNMPQAYIKKEVEIVPGTDGEKMSKSKGNVIPLFGTDEEIRKAVMSIVTDAKSPTDVIDPDENNIYNIHKLFLNNRNENLQEGNESLEKVSNDIEDLRNRFLKTGIYAGGSYSYKEAKDALYEAIIGFVGPMRETYDYYQLYPDKVYAILEKGKIKSQAKAQGTIKEVRRIVGLGAYNPLS